MVKKVNKKNRDKFSIYWGITLFILALYVLWMFIFLYISHLEIKNIYREIEGRKIDNQFIRLEIDRVVKEKKNKIFWLDLETDSSLTKFVNSSVPFDDKWYVPEDLLRIKSSFIDDMKWNQYLKSEAKNALEEMSKNFKITFNQNIKVVSAYRSYNYQAWIKQRWCPDNLCAKAGYSEHQSGLAVDLWEATTNNVFMSKTRLKNYYNWLSNNAHEYGFTNTYQKWLDIDWYEIEPWHWRYVWENLATYLIENNMTIAEFYNEIKNG